MYEKNVNKEHSVFCYYNVLLWSLINCVYVTYCRIDVVRFYYSNLPLLFFFYVKARHTKSSL